MKRFLPLLAAFVLCLSLTVPAFAATVTGDGLSFSTTYSVNGTLYDFAEHYVDNKETYPNLAYLIYTPSANIYKLYRSNGGFVTTSDTNKYFMSNGSVDEFVYDSSAEVWVYESSYTPSGALGFVADGSTHIIWASDDVMNYTGDGSVFEGDENFPTPPTPLAEQILGVTGETLNNQTVPALGGTMKTLVVCGVGLTALLVVLKLFGKRSLISLR